MCTTVVDYVGLESSPGLADFGNEVACIDSDAVLLLTLKQHRRFTSSCRKHRAQ